MKLKPKVIHQLAQYVVEHMSQSEAWTLTVEQGKVVQAIEKIIEKNLHEEEMLDAQAKALLAAQLAKMKDSTIDERKAFQLIKKQLAKQKGMVL